MAIFDLEMSDDDDDFGDFDSAPAAAIPAQLQAHEQATEPSPANEPSTLNNTSQPSDDIMQLSDEDFLLRAKAAWGTAELEASSISKEQDQQTIEKLRRIMEPILSNLSLKPAV